MYPQLMNQASRLAPLLSRILQRGGSFATPFWKTQQIDTPEVMAQPMRPGLRENGNIDLTKRPVVRNPDGSISTVRSMSANFGNGEVLIPTVSDDGRVMSNQEAIDTYKRTGKHLGIFDTPDNATAYAQSLHKDQEQMYATPQPPISGPQNISYPSAPISTDNSAPAAPSAPTPPPWWANGQMFNGPGFPSAPASQASSPTQPASTPMPQARPAEAPAPQEDTGFFMRNALMQQDPMGGGFIDPMGAKSVRGPDLIAKMMQYLHNKA
jgi:hypothetical protein